MSYVKFEVAEGVAKISLDYPQKGNALSEGMVRELTAALVEADQNSDVGAIILTGEGANFCTGGDLDDFIAASRKSLEEGYQDIQPSMALFALGFQLRTPLIARMQGAVRGGGVGVAALAHIAVAEPDTTFALPEVQLGVFPFGIFPLLARAMGPRRALELALSSRVFDAQEAKRYGLVHHVAVDSPEIAMGLGRMLASRSRLALTTGLEAYNHLTNPGSWPLDYLGLLRQLTFKSEILAVNVERFLSQRKDTPND